MVKLLKAVQSLKHMFGIVVTPLGILSCFSPCICLKAESLMVTTLFGNVMDVIPCDESKALSPMVVKPLGRVTPVKFSNELKVYAPNSVTQSPMVTLLVDADAESAFVSALVNTEEALHTTLYSVKSECCATSLYEVVC